MRKETIILMVLSVFIVGAIYYFETTKVRPDIVAQELMPTKPSLKDGKYPLAPELIGITGYINAEEGLQIKDFRGKVVLIDFWTYSCINCLRTLPHLTAWDAKYRDQGLIIIGVHTPEFEFEKKRENVEAAMKKHGIEYRVVQDNNYAAWSAYRNLYWPRKYLIDAEGYIRYDHIGEGAYEETELKILELLAEINVSVETVGLTTIPDTTPTLPTTPELYAGYAFALNRGQNIGNKEGLQVDKTMNYELSEKIEPNLIHLEGQWHSNKDNLEAKEENASIVLNYLAKSVNIVAMDGNAELEVFIDDSYINPETAGDDIQFDGERAFIDINEPRLYNVVDGNYERHTLKLTTNTLGFSFHAFTFG